MRLVGNQVRLLFFFFAVAQQVKALAQQKHYKCVRLPIKKRNVISHSAVTGEIDLLKLKSEHQNGDLPAFPHPQRPSLGL